jgi:hypothetical protein
MSTTILASPSGTSNRKSLLNPIHLLWHLDLLFIPRVHKHKQTISPNLKPKLLGDWCEVAKQIKLSKHSGRNNKEEYE